MQFLVKEDLTNLYLNQGGRCLYSYTPIYPMANHKYKISVERIDPRKNYNRENTVLVTIGLNGRPCGQFLNKSISSEQREIALANGTFNQIYWDKCTKLTGDIRIECEDAIRVDNRYLSQLKDQFA